MLLELLDQPGDRLAASVLGGLPARRGGLGDRRCRLGDDSRRAPRGRGHRGRPRDGVSGFGSVSPPQSERATTVVTIIQRRVVIRECRMVSSLLGVRERPDPTGVRSRPRQPRAGAGQLGGPSGVLFAQAQEQARGRRNPRRPCDMGRRHRPDRRRLASPARSRARPPSAAPRCTGVARARPAGKTLVGQRAVSSPPRPVDQDDVCGRRFQSVDHRFEVSGPAGCGVPPRSRSSSIRLASLWSTSRCFAS